MKVSTILDHIDSGHIALPEFQRGYVWNRDQVKGLFDSLYKKHPVGSLLVWATQSGAAQYRGEKVLTPGVVKLLLDGQQRITSLYGVFRGKPPVFFQGNKESFTGLYFHLVTEEFAFYQAIKMKDDPLWIDVTGLLKSGFGGLGAYLSKFSQDPALSTAVADYGGKLSRILAISDTDLHVEEVTGEDKSIEVVVDIFNKVNSGGTKLSKGDLALAKICSEWPEARKEMNRKLEEWSKARFSFDLDWFLRNMNAILTGEAKFQYLHNLAPQEIQAGLKRAEKAVNAALNLISGRLGLDQNQVLFGRYAFPVLSRYLDRKGCQLSAQEQNKLLFWFIQAGMWGRFSGSVESFLDQDLALIEDLDNGLDRLIEQVRLWHGGLKVEPGHFGGWSLGARFYSVLYMLTRVGEAKDWGTGLPIRKSLLGNNTSLEVHHIFPKAQLYKKGYSRPEVNAVANFCLLTKETNLKISDELPEIYFPRVEESHPGSLASQWIPTDPDLWKLENYGRFLEARKTLLADAANRFMVELLGGDDTLLGTSAPVDEIVSIPMLTRGGIQADDEEKALRELNEWVVQQGLPAGTLMYEVADPVSNQPAAVFDLAWPNGLQQGLSDPVAVLLNEGSDLLRLAIDRRYRAFTKIEDFRRYVEDEVLAIAR